MAANPEDKFSRDVAHTVGGFKNIYYSGLWQRCLTNICFVDLSILISWTNPFPILGVSGVLFHFYFILNRNSCKQTVKTLTRP